MIRRRCTSARCGPECILCGGSGIYVQCDECLLINCDGDHPCLTCDGSQRVTCTACDGDGYPLDRMCPECRGRAVVRCPDCLTTPSSERRLT